MRLKGVTDSPLSAFHAILVIVDTSATRHLLPETLHAVFDFTPAETRLATAIASGTDLTSFALSTKVSKETVRNQLKAVFEKTGTRRQSTLVGLLATLIPKK
jgi:DNA-binding CsgD family transcriptional regulator